MDDRSKSLLFLQQCKDKLKYPLINKSNLSQEFKKKIERTFEMYSDVGSFHLNYCLLGVYSICTRALEEVSTPR